jgi:hypothetical protein
MPKAAALAAVLAFAAAPLPSLARSVAGVKVPDTVAVAGQELRLNGAGVRSKFVFKVYVGALYLPAPSKDPKAIVEADAPKEVRMFFLRDVSRKQIQEAFEEGFEANSRADAADLQKQLPEVMKAIGNVKEGQEIVVTYAPGAGTTVTGPGGTATVAGKPLADGLFRNWLGPKPASEDLRDGMLGK